MDRGWLTYESLGALQGICFQCVNIDQLHIQIQGIRYTESSMMALPHPHRHDFFEFHYIADGGQNTVINGLERTYNAGQYYLMVPGVMHAHSNRKPCPMTEHHGFALRWAMVRNDQETLNPEIEALWTTLHNAPPFPISDEGGALLGRFRAMIEMANAHSSETQLKLQFASLLLMMSQAYQNPGIADSQTMSADAETAIINAAVNYIQQHCCEPLSVRDISEAVHVSYSHLSRLFAKRSLESISGYVTRCRIDKAQHLLLTSNFAVSEIAELVGFSTVSHFSSTFHKCTHMSPMKYRMSYSQYNGGIPTEL